MISISHDSQARELLEAAAKSCGLTFLAVHFIPTKRVEGRYLEVGSATSGPRNVVQNVGPRGRLELHSQGSELPTDRALEVLQKMAPLEQPWVAEQIHDSVCQSLTAAHLHLEFALMTHPDNAEFRTARALVSEANSFVRDLMDRLAGAT